VVSAVRDPYGETQYEEVSFFSISETIRIMCPYCTIIKVLITLESVVLIA
jgi:hypothetical protein